MQMEKQKMTRWLWLGVIGIMATLGLADPWREKLWGEDRDLPKASSNWTLANS